MSNIPPPKEISWTENRLEDFKVFKTAYENFEIATQLDGKEDKIRVASLLAIIGSKGVKMYNNLTLTAAEKMSVTSILQKMEEFLKPTQNTIYDRYVFNSATQREDESIPEFVSRLRSLVKNCSFGDLENELLRDRLVIGVESIELRKHLLSIPNLTFEEAMKKCKVYEATNLQLEKIESKASDLSFSVNKIQHKQKFNAQQVKKCKWCGGSHKRVKQACPAYGSICSNCKRKNHFKNVCLSKNVNIVMEDNSDDSAEEDYINAITDQKKSKKLFSTLVFEVNKSKEHVKCELDTGATTNVIGMENLCSIMKTSNIRLKATKVRLRAFGGKMITPLGRFVMNCLCLGKVNKLVFQVVDFHQPPLLSKNTCMHLKLITVNNVLQLDAVKTKETLLDKFSDVFKGDGKLPGKISLTCDGNVRPVQQKPRRIPVAVKEELQKELDDLEQRGMVEKVEEPSEWISNILIVRRKQKLRICLDPFQLNKALQREHLQSSTIEEILPEVSKAKIFSTLDAKNGFWQCELDEDSRKLTTFWTPNGRYSWKRLPFGVSPAPELYQKKQKEALCGLKGVEVIADDILVYGCGDTEEEAVRDHDRKLECLLQRCREKNMKLNKNKAVIRKKEVPFFGHLLTSDGLKPDPCKVDSIKRMKEPTCSKEAQSLVAFCVYLSKFLPKLSTVIEPIMRVAQEKTIFVWQEEQKESFSKMKQLVTEITTLKFFDPKKPVTIQCDASSTGLGAALLQDDVPVMYASRTLTKTERKYAQIEKECLAILFACKRFDKYICGRGDAITVQTDHKPLLSIFSTDLNKAPKRIQRMMLSLTRYDIVLTYKKGKEMVIAVLLSRYIEEDSSPEENIFKDEVYQIFEEIEEVNAFAEVNMNDVMMKIIKQQSECDEEMKVLQQLCRDGWPDNKSELNPLAVPYWSYKESIVCHSGVLINRDRIIIPKSLRQNMLTNIHLGHPGKEQCLRRARTSLFWPGINEQIKSTCDSCSVCAEFANSQSKQPMQSVEIPELPYERVSIDIGELVINNKKIWLLVSVDHYSDFLEVDILKNITAAEVIESCKKQFSRHGTPKVVHVDCGSQFLNKEFCKFASEWNFLISTSSPYHHQSNGKAANRKTNLQKV